LPWAASDLPVGAVVEIDERQKSLRLAADDGEHQRQIVMHGAHHRFRAAADSDPGFERAVLDLRKYRLMSERRPRRVCTAPGPNHLIVDASCGSFVRTVWHFTN
jgi:hypothetical protein